MFYSIYFKYTLYSSVQWFLLILQDKEEIFLLISLLYCSVSPKSSNGSVLK